MEPGQTARRIGDNPTRGAMNANVRVAALGSGDFR